MGHWRNIGTLFGLFCFGETVVLMLAMAVDQDNDSVAVMNEITIERADLLQ